MAERTVDIDEVLNHIGGFGPYQRKIYFFLCIPILFVGAQSLSYVFIAAKPDYRCIVPSCESGNKPAFNTSFLEFTIPKRDGHYDECSRYAHLNHTPWIDGNHITKDEDCSAKYFSEMTIEDCPEGHVFDKSIYESTIITEFNLTCEGGWEAQASQSIYFGGMLVGAMTWGFVADWLGRRITIVVNLVLMALFGIGTALVPNITMFNIMRFFNAMTSAGVFQTAFVLSLEFVGPQYRVGCSVVGQYVFALGELMLGSLGLYFRTWRMLQLLISVPLTIGLLYWFIVPESPRWLQSCGDHMKLFHLMQTVARVNKKPFPDHLFAVNDDVTDETHWLPLPTSSNEEEQAQEIEPRIDADDVFVFGCTNDLVSVSQDGDNLSVTSPNVSFLQVLQTPLLCLRLFAMILIWVVTTLVYYGLSMNATDLGTDPTSNYKPYVNFMLSALIEIPGYTLAWLLQHTVGRKIALGISLLLAGTSCIGAGLVYQLPSVHSLIASLVGKCGITSAFGIIYLYTAEIFPTNVRNTVLGTCSTFARIGGMMAPFSDDLKSVYPPLPMLLFGVLSMVSVLAALVQPETRGSKLPDTIEEALQLGGGRVAMEDEDEAGPLLPQDEEQ